MIKEEPDIIESYQEVTIQGMKYWDYNFKIKGVTYEVSVNKKTGRLFIYEDKK